MKLQCLHDRYDLLKWDLLLKCLKTGGFQRFVYVPMLTQDDGSGEGKRRRPDGPFDPCLVSFRKNCLRDIEEGKSERELTVLRRFWARTLPEIEYLPHRDNGPWFTHEGRAAYFAAVPDAWLKDALVFLDPDIGLEAINMTRNGIDRRNYYLLWNDVRNLALRLSGKSCMVVYQHLLSDNTKVAHTEAGKAIGLMDHTGWEKAGYLSDGDVAFLAVAPDVGVTDVLEIVFRRYADEHGWPERNFAFHAWGNRHLFMPTRSNLTD